MGEHRGLLLDALLNDKPLILDQILNFEGGRKQFGRSAEMVELASGQRQHGYFQVCQFGVVERRVQTSALSKEQKNYFATERTKRQATQDKVIDEAKETLDLENVSESEMTEAQKSVEKL